MHGTIIIFTDSHPMLANDLPQCELANAFLTLLLFYAITIIAHRKLGTVPGWVDPRVRN